jgi:MFS family permease
MGVGIVFLVRDIGLSAGVIGLLGVVGLGGALLASWLTGRLVARFGQVRAMLLGAAGIGPAFLAQAFTTPGWGLLWWVASGFVASFGIVLTNIVMASVRQTVCPPALLGRVGATMELAVWGVMPVGSLLGGVLGTVLGTRATLLWSGAVACLGVVWLLAAPAARRTGIVGAAG